MHNPFMSRQPEWNDLRIFLAVARLGTISLAGERLGVEHTTISRRLDRLEASLGLVLFDRRRNGYSLTAAGHALVPHVEKMEIAALEAIDQTSETEAQVRGAVRVGTPEAFGICVLVPSLIDLHATYPGLQIQLMAQPQFPSLVTREVEILVTLEPPEVGRYKILQLGQVEYFIYCSKEYLERHGAIDELRDVALHPFVDYIHDGSVSDRYRILEELVSQPIRSFVTTSVLAQRAAAVSGLGLVLLTPYVAEHRDDLFCLFPGKVLMSRSLWIAAPEDLLRTKRVRIVWDHIRNLIGQHPRFFRRRG